MITIRGKPANETRDTQDDEFQHLKSVISDLNDDVDNQEERVQKLERCVEILQLYVGASYDRINTLTHHINILRRVVDHVDQMKREIETLETRLKDLKRTRGLSEDVVIHEAVVCD